jgi:hypothetical protein
MTEPVREIEVEVLPPDAPGIAGNAGNRSGTRGSSPTDDGPKVYAREEEPLPDASANRVRADDPFIALMAKLMDNAFTIPGTKIRFGLDPIIGLWPGIGDGASALTSVLLLAQSARHRIPKIVLARMAMNIVLNATLGAMPVLGDAFSFWFKSNERNYELFRKHSTSPSVSTKPDWLFVGGLIGGVAVVLVLTVIGYATMIVTLTRLLFGR